MGERPGFPGEDPAQQMHKLQRSNAAVTCASCQRFDGHAWCRRWNYHTTADAPICSFYRAHRNNASGPGGLRET